MELSTIMEQIKTKNTIPFYVFMGEELAIMDTYISKIAESVKLPVIRLDSVAEATAKLRTPQLFGHNSCILVRDDVAFTKADKSWDAMETLLLQGDSILILVYSKLDKRGKFYKYMQEKIAVFEKLSPEVLRKYIKKKFELGDTSANLLIQYCNSDYSTIF